MQYRPFATFQVGCDKYPRVTITVTQFNATGFKVEATNLVGVSWVAPAPKYVNATGEQCTPEQWLCINRDDAFAYALQWVNNLQANPDIFG